MRESTKSKLASLIAVLAVAFIAFFLIFALNSLGWPVGSAVGKVLTQIPNPVKVPDGLLLVSVISNQTIIPSDLSVIGEGVFVQNPSVQPLTGILVAVYLNSVTSPTITNFTDNSGQIQETLAPNSYTIKFFDWRLNNLSVPIQINSNNVTELDVVVNASSYAVESFNIADPDSSGFAVGWGQIFAQVPTNQTIPATNQLDYVDSVDPLLTPINNINLQSLTAVSLAASSNSNSSQWLQISVKSPIYIGRIQSMTILTLASAYVVRSYAIE